MQHWIQRITFAAETNAACSRGSARQDYTQCCGVWTHTQRDRRRVTQYLRRSLSDSEGNKD